MQSTQELKQHIRSIKTLTQMTQAIETVSATKVRKAVSTLQASRPYTEKAWKVLMHLARQPAHSCIHPLLNPHHEVKQIWVVVVSGNRGLAGSFNTQIIDHTLNFFQESNLPISFISIGSKGSHLLQLHQKDVIASYNQFPETPTFSDMEPIGNFVINGFINDQLDLLYLAYTRYISKMKQQTIIRKILPLEIAHSKAETEQYNLTHPTQAVFSIEPEGNEVIDQIVKRFTILQIQAAILESLASEHASRMVTMHNATDSGETLTKKYMLQYHKTRQNTVTEELLDVINGTKAIMGDK